MPENFAFAIQSYWYDRSSIYILNKNEIGVALHSVCHLVLLSGTPGWYLVLLFYIKILGSHSQIDFVSLWFGFGLVLWWQNRNKEAADWIVFLTKTKDKMLLSTLVLWVA